jgi:hypothetical protein
MVLSENQIRRAHPVNCGNNNHANRPSGVHSSTSDVLSCWQWYSPGVHLQESYPPCIYRVSTVTANCSGLDAREGMNEW